MRLHTLHLIPLSIHPQGVSRFPLRPLDTANHDTNPFSILHPLTARLLLHLIRHPHRISTHPPETNQWPHWIPTFQARRSDNCCIRAGLVTTAMDPWRITKSRQPLELKLDLDNCTRLLQPLLDYREDDPPALEALGLPLQWRGLEGAVIYYRMLEAAKKKSTLSLLAKRIGQILFYLNYRWLEKHMTGSSKSVATLILNDCPEEPKDPKLLKSRRDNITGYHKRRGERWWLHAACLGPGILTHASRIMETEYALPERFSTLQLIHVHRIITSSKKEKVQVFISLMLRVRPGSVNFFGRWAPVIKAIALGAPTSELRQTLEASNADTVRQAELACAYESDQEALSRQQIGETWMAIDVESIAEKKIAEFLPDY